MKININVTALLIVLMGLIAFFAFAMIYSHLTYVAPANTPEWQLPGIADKGFVMGTTITLTFLFVILLFSLKSEMNKKKEG